ncbi:MAG: hypothetical protein JKY62_16820 [Desulfocapsa sp.]|nr:hypothetical protein [Desulfocapsa sp.]
MALTVGSNSYGSRTEANTYFGDSINSDIWTAFSNTKKDQGLVEATRLLERELWQGTKEVALQDLHFPATGVTDCAGVAVDPADTLETAKVGQFEYALALLNKPSLLNSTDATGTNLKQAGAGSAKVIFFKPKKGSKYPLQVLSVMKCYFAGSDGGTGMVSSGTGDSTSFDDCNSYDVTQGFK